MQQLAQLLAALAVSDVGDDDDDVVTTDPVTGPSTGVNGQSLVHRQTGGPCPCGRYVRHRVSPSVCPVSPEKT